MRRNFDSQSTLGLMPGVQKATDRPRTLVWIDAREALISRWRAGRVSVKHIKSDVPAHHAATGHVRHDPRIRHGGGPRLQTAGEAHRHEHLARFLDQVASRISPDDDLLILGPGTVREHLERLLRDRDQRRGSGRELNCEPASRITRPQLIARLRDLAGASPHRLTVGAYRWTRLPRAKLSRPCPPPPRRVLDKPRPNRAGADAPFVDLGDV